MLIFWLVLCWGIFVFVSWVKRRTKRSWPILLLMLLAAVVAGAHIWRISWRGYGANFSRMIALQVIVAALAVWIRHMQTNGRQIIGASIVVLSLPLIWLIIQSQWLHLHMIFDVSLLDQRITILVGEASFLLLAYLGWLDPRIRKNGDNKAIEAAP